MKSFRFSKSLLLLSLGAILVAPSTLAAEEASVEEDYASFSLPGFTAVIGNNVKAEPHLRGYNGLFSLTSETDNENAFVPLFSGLNLEHYFDAQVVTEPGSVFFEPRRAPMTFKRISDHSCELHQPVTPVYGVESTTRFTFKEPHYVDMHFSCTPTRDDLAGGFLGVFWASYINAPEDKSMYFLAAGSSLDEPQWLQLCTQTHNRDSTVCNETDNFSIDFQGEDKTLFKAISPLRYSLPFFYGRIRDQVLIYIFTPGPTIRFAHSPSGAGPTEKGDDTNPAWDFQLIVPDYQPGESYHLDMRLVYKKWMGRDDVLQEVRRYFDEINAH
jgi:hypothetical protein